MAFVGLDHVTILNNNQILVKGVTTWILGNLSVVSGFGEEMLEDDDASTQFKTASVGASAPYLGAYFGSSTSVSCCAVVNHNLGTAGYSTLYVDYSDDGASWPNIGSYSISICGDRDFALFFTATGHNRYRIRFDAAHDNFKIGYLYFGTAVELSANTIDSGFIQVRRPATRYIDSAGGGLHVIKGKERGDMELQMSFSRMTGANLNAINLIGQKIVGVIPPEYATAPHSAPNGQDVFFGRITETSIVTRTPGSVSTSTNVYDVNIAMRGAV